MDALQMPVPLHLVGNTTEQQSLMLQEFLSEAAKHASRTAIKQLDRQSAQVVLDMNRDLSTEVANLIVETIHRYTVSDKYKSEEVASDRVYPPAFKVRSIEFQVTELRKAFPSLGACMEKIARKPLPEGAENWFAIPRWQALAPTYSEAVEMIIGALGKKRKFQNRIGGRMDGSHLRQTARSKLADKLVTDQQQGCDILVVGLQIGMLHRGVSARRVRVSLAGNEFALGAFACGCILLTHPERLSCEDTLMIDCGGDEYSLQGTVNFDRTPLFDYDISGVEFSVFYDDRASNLWGTPTGFLVKRSDPGTSRF